jgi:hypothetical protein
MLVALPDAIPAGSVVAVTALGAADDVLRQGFAMTAPIALPQMLMGAETATVVVLPEAISPPSAWAAPAESSMNPPLATVMPSRYCNRLLILKAPFVETLRTRRYRQTGDKGLGEN